MPHARLANLLIDTVDRLTSAETEDARWEALCAIAGGIGATAANAAEVDLTNRQPTWARYNMDAAWLDEYAEAELHVIDPIVAGAILGRVPQSIDVARDLSALPPSQRVRQCQAGLLRHDYHFFTSRGLRIGQRYRILVLASDRDPRDLYGPGTGRAFDAVSEVLLSQLSPVPQGILGAHQGQLYSPERDALSFLALGYSREAVAERMRISLAQLRVHLRESCRKLGVETPEQAMAAALMQGKLQL